MVAHCKNGGRIYTSAALKGLNKSSDIILEN